MRRHDRRWKRNDSRRRRRGNLPWPAPPPVRYLPVAMLAVALMVIAAIDVAAETAPASVPGGVLGASWLGYAAVMLIGLLLSAFFSGAETALVSLDRVVLDQLAESGNRRARFIKRLSNAPERMLGMTLVGTNLMNVLTSEFGLLMWIVILHAPGPINRVVVQRLGVEADAVAILVTSVLILVFGEILPKTVSRARPNAVSMRYAMPMRVFDVALLPVVAVLTAVTNRVARAIGRGMQRDEPGMERDELRLLATMGEQSGGLASAQRQMIHGVLDLRKRTVGQVMVPLVHMRALPLDATPDVFHRAAARHGHSRFPVYTGRVDNVIGIIHVLDVIYAEQQGTLTAEMSIEQLVRTDVSFFPELKSIYELLEEIRGSRMTMALVVDEYGGVVGLVTVEDMLEEIAGQLVDERDTAPAVTVVAPRVLECDGLTEIEDLRGRYRLRLPVGDYETIAGLVLHERGRVPRRGESVRVGPYTITVLEADRRTIKSVRIATT